ncbi:cytochrome B561 [Asaia krungthepensis NRIC 0535]|uniref:Cytochrome B561 n=1 Tax=Asaia krungthepensis NRIC 0535 TaxID=1307925 RepID=A0ABQ0Q3P1_9PROT|nr:cytochrome B561 [Asaia krungthepensis NRIC 0535]
MTRFLHWSMALGLGAQIALGLSMTHAGLTDTQAYRAFQVHRALGVTLGILAMLRVLWRLGHRLPYPHRSQSRLVAGLARGGHALLYSGQILLPLTGYGLACAAGPDMPLSMFGLFDWPLLSFSPGETGVIILTAAHRWGAWVFALLIAGHAAAALCHAALAHDDVWKRMGPSFPCRSRSRR